MTPWNQYESDHYMLDVSWQTMGNQRGKKKMRACVRNRNQCKLLHSKFKKSGQVEDFRDFSLRMLYQLLRLRSKPTKISRNIKCASTTHLGASTRPLISLSSDASHCDAKDADAWQLHTCSIRNVITTQTKVVYLGFSLLRNAAKPVRLSRI
jgi:hypothetical protein